LSLFHLVIPDIPRSASTHRPLGAELVVALQHNLFPPTILTTTADFCGIEASSGPTKMVGQIKSHWGG
jgi:hypothetical protein